jgi:N-acetyl-gamma-glutamyl-phosphate reductase
LFFEARLTHGYAALLYGENVMKKVFIDGQVGTTGLQIHQRLSARAEIELLQIADADRKNPEIKQQIINSADVVILCLPDDAARQTVSMVNNPETRVLDASTAHRVADDWTYGLAELAPDSRAHISNAARVSNPGCWATGFTLAVAPLIRSGLLRADIPLLCHGVSGYTGGGRQMIEKYEARSASHPGDLWNSRPYALTLTHKHLAEMQHYSGSAISPFFMPSVGHFAQGMLVNIPLPINWFNKTVDLQRVQALLAETYQDEPCVAVHTVNDAAALDEGFLEPQANNGSNRCDIFVFGDDQQILLISRLDNLGKGAAGAAVQNLNLMLGMTELSGLNI